MLDLRAFLGSKSPSCHLQIVEITLWLKAPSSSLHLEERCQACKAAGCRLRINRDPSLRCMHMIYVHASQKEAKTKRHAQRALIPPRS